MENLKIEYLPVGSLKPYEKNAKRHPADQVEHIANSIREFGFRQPLVIDKGNVLVIGHGRLLAAKKLGLDTVPCVRADDLTEEQIKALRLADNKTNESEWDFDLLGGELDDIFDIDMEQFGFDVSLGDEPQEVVEDDVPEEVETRCKLGDKWKLGEHFLICGDSTDPAVIDRLMDGVKAKLLLTDPPYGVKIVKHEKGGGDKQIGTTHGKGSHDIVPAKVYSKIIGDETTETARQNFIICKDYTDIQILFGGNYFTDFLPPSRCWIVWDKGMSKESFFAMVELAWCSKDGNALIYKYLWSGVCREGSREVEGQTRMHPTQKPVGLMANIIKDFTVGGDSVLDCFGGSGSTLIACEQLNRKCYMCELDPHYCDVIIQRWENLTGETAVLLNG